MRQPTAVLVSAIAVAAFCTTQAGAVTVLFSDFSSSAGLTLNLNAQTNVNNGIDAAPVLRLAQADYYRAGSAFSQTMLNAANFSTYFQFRLTNPGGAYDGTAWGADGIAFVVQPVSSSLGYGGGGLGYAGISPSVAVEFDSWWNPEFDADSNHVGIDVNGVMCSLQTVPVSPDLNDGNLWHAWIDYDGGTLSVRINQSGIRPAFPILSRTIDVPATIGTTAAYVGFTGATGAAFANHDIVYWEYRDQFDPIEGAVPEPLTILAVGLSSLAAGGYARRRTLRPAVPV